MAVQGVAAPAIDMALPWLYHFYSASA